MMVTVDENRYGKEGVRLVKVRRTPQGNTFDEWTVRVLVEGDFVSSYTEGDNSKVLTTDTMKNTIYYLAQRTRTTSMEDFAKELIDFLLQRNLQISSVDVHVARKAWSNIETSNGIRHPTAFVKTSNEIQVTNVKRSRYNQFSIISGLEQLTVMKTADSSFSRFYKDELTTLPEADDRLFGTSIQAQWIYNSISLDFEKLRQKIRSMILDIFADHKSASVQHTLYAIGKYILENVKQVDKISFTMPNIHCLPFDLSRFGEENKNEIFMPIDDPHGFIQCSMSRNSNQTTVISKL